MTGKKEPGARWRHVTITMREDIFARANEAGVDIHNACNRALADLVGIDYRQQKIEGLPVTPPVIIAAERPVAGTRGETPKITPEGRPPVINADDPSAVVKAMAKRRTAVKPVPEVPVPSGSAAGKEGQRPSPAPLLHPPAKGLKSSPKKRETGGGLKKFVSAKISRVDADDAIISKDDLYQAFSRWCREQKIAPVPDRKAVAVALKNQFAIKERTADGVPSWVNIRLK